MFVLGAALTACLLSTAPAAAATTITFTGSSALNGTDGNVRTFSSSGITVQATAWSYSGSTLQKSWLGAYGNGLGVTNPTEGDGSNYSHAADNYARNDFILLVFNQAVNIAAAKLNPYGQNGGAADNDVSVSYTNFAGLFASPVPATTAIGTGSAVFGQLNGNLWNLPGNLGSGYNTNLNSAGLFGNVWLIGAARTNPDQTADGFKLGAITVSSAVPEPGTWMMLLLGFGAIGAAMRRRRVGALLPA